MALIVTTLSIGKSPTPISRLPVGVPVSRNNDAILPTWMTSGEALSWVIYSITCDMSGFGSQSNDRVTPLRGRAQ